MFARKVSRLLYATSNKFLAGSVASRRTLPVCSVQTNLADSQIPDDFQEGLGKLLANTLKKPEDVILIYCPYNVLEII